MKEIQPFTKYEVDRAVKLDRARERLDLVESYRKKDKPWIWTFKDVDRQRVGIILDRHLAFGIWLVIQSLVQDFDEIGRKDIAEEIINERKTT